MNSKNSKYEYMLLVAAGCLLGILCFVCVYGVKVLDFTYDAWLFNWDIDLKQHYVGWCHYRNAGWQFPIGMIDSLSVPYSMSVVYTDSIPLFAIFFKLFRDYLPVHFQYFGLFGIMSFAMQGALSTVLLRRFIKNKFICISSSLIFIMSFTVIHRMYYHTALAAQWIIVLALIIWFYRSEDAGFTKMCIKWGLMALLCVLIHSYFIAMTGMIMLVERLEIIIKRISKSKINKERLYLFRVIMIELLPVLSFCVVTIATLFVLGGFSGAGSVSGGGLGVFGANINTYFNPDSMGRILKALPYSTGFQYEGFGYLGAGILLIYLWMLVKAIVNCIKIFVSKKSLSNDAGNYKVANLKECVLNYLSCINIKRKLLVLLIVISFVSAIFPYFSFNEKKLFAIPLPKACLQIFGIFRSNGRFIWVSMYVLMLIAIVYTARHMSKRYMYVVLMMSVLIQLYDISAFVKTRNDYFDVKQEFDNPFESLETYNIYNGKTNFVLLYNEVNLMMEAGMYGYLHDMTMNVFYYARPINEEMDMTIQAYKDEIRKGIVRDDTIYVVKEEELYSDDLMFLTEGELRRFGVSNCVVITK